jgi:transcription initiation factor TFIIIB Brf1 subunit/transcription initiation factor TFIIB
MSKVRAGSTSGRRSRSRIAFASVIGIGGVIAALALPGAASASSVGRLHPSAAVQPQIARAGVHYARIQPLCAAAKPGQFSCFAMRRVPVSVKPGTALPQGVHSYAFGHGFAGGYSPSDLASLYHYSRSGGGAGQTIGIVDWFDDPNALTDLNSFDADYGFPAETATSFRKVNEHGAAAPLPLASAQDQGSADSSPEISLDVQTARAVCAKCKIVLVEANASASTGPTNADLAAAENTAVRLGATEVSNSFGGAENRHASAAAYASFAKAFNHKGVVITASTGDHGWYDWDFFNAGFGGLPNDANTPSTFNTVVAVGGTKLTDTGKKSTTVRKAETVWNENGKADDVGGPANTPEGASGGGCSALFAAKRWQHDVAGYSKTGCGSKRLAADISAVADPNTGFDVIDTWDGLNDFTVGGTSLSSPLVASMWALAGGARGVAYPALTVYGNALSHPSTLHDITSGGNAFCDAVKAATCVKDAGGEPNEQPGVGRMDCSFVGETAKITTNNHQCVAAKGYDGPSGVGTPNGLKAFTPLHPSATIKAPKFVKGKKGTFSEKTRDPFPGGAIAKYSWNFGDGKHGGGAHPKHTYTKAKAFTVTLTVTDIYGFKHTTTLKVHVKK